MAGETWFAELYRGCYRRLVLTAYGMTGDLGVAEEIAQEAFTLAYGRRGRVSRTDSPEAWLRTVVVNLARRRFRRTATLDRLLRRPSAEPALTDLPLGEHLDLHVAIRRLDADLRSVVVLHYLVLNDGLTNYVSTDLGRTFQRTGEEVAGTVCGGPVPATCVRRLHASADE